MGVSNKPWEYQTSRGCIKQVVVASCVAVCPLAEDGLQLFACPTPDEFGEFKCIDDNALCDLKAHCPNAEDEDKTVCMFHKMVIKVIITFLQ